MLRILRGAGVDGLPTLKIGDRMIEQTPGVTHLIDRLVTKGLVTRERGTLDMRRVICRITPAGLDLLARTDTPIDEADDFMLSELDHRELRTLIELLDRVRAGMTAPAAEAAPAASPGKAPLSAIHSRRTGKTHSP